MIAQNMLNKCCSGCTNVTKISPPAQSSTYTDPRYTVVAVDLAWDQAAASAIVNCAAN